MVREDRVKKGVKELRKTLVLFSAVLVLLATSVVPAGAQAGEEGICAFFAEENGYLCTLSPFRDIDLRCPAEEPAEEGDVLDCRSTETDERFACTVVEEIVDGFIIRVSCVPFEEEPPPGEEEPPPDDDAGAPGEPPSEAVGITQELEQEAESGEVDQSFDVS